MTDAPTVGETGAPRVEIDLSGPVARVVLGGDLDLAVTGQIADALASAMSRGEADVDVSDVSFIDSSCLGALVGAARAGLYVRVVGASDVVRRSFVLSGMDDLVHMH